MSEEKMGNVDNREMVDPFLEGNEIIEEAIERFFDDDSDENLKGILDAIRRRMHEDGHFIIPVVQDEEDEEAVLFRTVQLDGGEWWQVAFTSQEEFKKGADSEVMSYFIDEAIKSGIDIGVNGYVINPWGDHAFKLSRELMEAIVKADGDVEYIVPQDDLTEELLEDGSYLKRAIEICNRNSTKYNILRLFRILSDSYVWVPCNAVMSERDQAAYDKMINDAIEKNSEDGLNDALIGMTHTNEDEVRMVPDILQNDDRYFFPVFTTAEEMGEYGEHFSKVQMPVLQAINLAENNEYNVEGIVINAFSDPFVVNRAGFELIEEMASEFEEKAE